MSLICLVLTGKSLAEDLQAIGRFRDSIDLAELRADYLEPAELSALSGFPRRAGLPLILTLRRSREEGRFKGGEAERRRVIFRALGEGATGAGYRYVDLEEDLADQELEQSIRAAGGRIIRSIHDFSGVPNDLAVRIRGLVRHPDDIPKAEILPRDSRQLLELLEVFLGLTREKLNQDGARILIGMGELGLPTRILAAKLGSLLTFCAVPNRGSAPGQLDPLTLESLYRFRSLDSGTRVYGVIGNPIAHSRSPEIHNCGYRELGLNAVYLPFRVDDLESFLRLADLLDIRGLSVTLPFKEKVLAHLGTQDPALADPGGIGACNTMVRKGGCWYGTNTDVEGFLAPLREAGLISERPGEDGKRAIRRAAVIGAGGGARAVVYALVREGIEVLILNRTLSRANALAESFGCTFGGLDSEGIDRLEGYSGLIVQCTRVGMEVAGGEAPFQLHAGGEHAGGADAFKQAAFETDPIPDYRFNGSEVVYDLVYKPLKTRLLKRAEAAGCRTISGLEMLKAQAAAQFRLFTGLDYPEACFE